jgi:hypothetical protein
MVKRPMRAEQKNIASVPERTEAQLALGKNRRISRGGTLSGTHPMLDTMEAAKNTTTAATIPVGSCCTSPKTDEIAPPSDDGGVGATGPGTASA